MMQRIPWPYRIAVLVIALGTTLVTHFAVRGADLTLGVDVTNGPPIEPFLDGSLVDQDHPDVTPSFDTHVEIRPDHSVVVTERIGEYFFFGQRGIFRDIPIFDQYGNRRQMRSVEVRTTPGTPDDVKLESFDEGIRIRVGDPDQFITGAHGYQITYVLDDAMFDLIDVARFEFSTVTGWGQPIASLGYRVDGPTAIVSSICGLSFEPCGTDVLSSTGVEVALGGGASDPYLGDRAQQIALDYPRDAFDPAPARSEFFVPMPIIGTAIGISIMILLGYGIHDVRRRRTLRIAARSIDQTFSTTSSVADRHPGLSELSTHFRPDSADGSKPAPLPDQPPIEFVPPLGLDPAQAFRLSGRSAIEPGHLYAATLLDLAADGVIDLVPENDSFRVRRRQQEPRVVTDYELVLLEAALGDESSALLSDRTARLQVALPRYRALLDDSLRRLGLGTKFSAPSGKSKVLGQQVLLACSIGFIAFFTSLWATVDGTYWVAWVSVPLTGITATTWGLLDRAWYVRGLSPLGRAAAYRVRGFERFFSESEGRQARFAERQGLFREYMGYALAFGALTTWIELAPPTGLPEGWSDPNGLVRFSELTQVSGFTSPSSSGGSTSGFTGGGGGSVGGGGGGRW